MAKNNGHDGSPGAVVLGLGISGEAAAELLAAQGFRVTVIDDGDTPSLRARADLLRGLGVTVFLGAVPLPRWTDFVVVSPGIAGSHPLVAEALGKGIPVKGEIELAGEFIDIPISAVTGTNGKTTTVELLSRIFQAAGRPACPAGNFGYPLSRVALAPGSVLELALELSSFQIERLEKFQPTGAAFLNFAPDHLDRHPDPETYFRAKARLFRQLAPGGAAVVPHRLLHLLQGYIPPGVRIVTWGGAEADFQAVEDGIWTCLLEPAGILVPSGAIKLMGKHNLENIMAAAGLALCRGVEPEALLLALEEFRGIPHRLEQVGRIQGVAVVNDSKATNPHAVAAALAAFPGGVVWIAGGSEKAADFTPLRPLVSQRVRHAVFLGDTAERLQGVFGELVDTVCVKTLAAALEQALKLARPGETVILSPGCASFDMFKNYGDRGDQFRQLVTDKIQLEHSP